jgi:hypothetical protein
METIHQARNLQTHEGSKASFTNLMPEFIPKMYSRGVIENEEEITIKEDLARAIAIMNGAQIE